MKNNFDLKDYMKSNKVGAYQQLNEMWYQDINQALGDFNTMKEVEERESEYNKEMEEGKNAKFFVDSDDSWDTEAESWQATLAKKGIKAKITASMGGYEITLADASQKPALEKWLSRLNLTLDPYNLEEMGGVKTIGDAGKMATPNSRPNLGRHRSSDMLDKMSKKDHKTNTVVGAKAAAYKAPHMKEETADDIFAGSDKANWDNYGNETSEWDTEIAGQTVKGWTAEETQGGAIAWENPKYPNAHIYATPGWEGVDGIAFELHDSEDGYMDEPKIQKVIGSGTEAWKTKEGYMALMAKAFTVVEKMLIPSDNMDEDHGTQVNHDMNDDISMDYTEPEHMVQNEGIQDYNHTFEEDIMDLLDDGVSKPEILTHFKDILKNANPRMEESIENEDADPFGSIKTGIDQITQGDDGDMDMSDDDRFDQLGGDKIKAGIEGLMGDGFDYREILQFVKDTIASKRNY
jgi:hypothetical protein